jgi:ribonuclease D
MKIIKSTNDLAEYCEFAKNFDFVTIDTEFLRERTYYSKLCLIQMAVPSDDPDAAVIVDTLAEGLSLDPFYALLTDKSVVKVFHAARQDLEIFFVQGGVFPDPLFDTQIAAMVCGFGEQVGYDTLVRKIVKETVDKSSRFTDWSRRPLSEEQLTYALGDVTFLRDVYVFLEKQLVAEKRVKWVEEELEILTTPETYIVEPDMAWLRVKTRLHSGKFLAIVRELAKFRENHAQSNNVPRNRVFKDDALLELASTKPKKHSDIGKSRLLQREARRGDISDGILKAIEVGLNCPPEDHPKVAKTMHKEATNQGLADLLRVLLKAKAEGAGVAQKLIATTAELDALAGGDRSSAAVRGWRKDVFGADALRLCDGEIALSANGKSVKIVSIEACDQKT